MLMPHLSSSSSSTERSALSSIVSSCHSAAAASSSVLAAVGDMAVGSASAGLGASGSASNCAMPAVKDTTFTKIFVGGLPYHTTDASLREHFQVYGEIEEAVVITDRQTGKSRGYGFVTMADRLAAERACKDANPIIDGRKANVNLAYLGAKPRGNLQAGFPLAAALRAGFPALLPGQYGVGPQLLYPSPYVTPPGLMPLPPSAAAAAAANSLSSVSPAAAAAAAAAAVASGFYDYPAAYAATQFGNGFDSTFPFGAAGAAAAAGAANYMTPAFTYAASLPPALQSPATASLPLSHYAAQSQLQEARMQ